MASRTAVRRVLPILLLLAVSVRVAWADEHRLGEALRAAEQAERAGRVAAAEQHYKEALVEARELAATDYRFLSHTLSHFGSFYERQGRYAEAEPLYLENLALRERVLGPDDEKTLLSLNHLAGLYIAWKKYDQAEAYYLRELATREKTLGAEHPALGSTYVKLARVYRDLGRYELAEPYYRRAIALLEKGRFEEHRELVAALTGYAELLKKKHPIRSRLPGSEARELEKRAQAVTDALYPGRARQRRGTDFGTYLVVGFFGFYGLLVGFNGLRMLIRMYASRHWPTTEGTIASSEWVKVKGPGYRLDVTYRYNVEGSPYVGDVVCFAMGNFVWRGEDARRQVARYAPETSAPVYYCPRNPKLATLQPGGPILNALSGVLFGIAMLIVVLVVFSD